MKTTGAKKHMGERTNRTSGWTCPGCGASWAIWVKGCDICNGYAKIRAQSQNVRISTTTTGTYGYHKE